MKDKQSKRILKLEREMFELVNKAKKSLTLEDLKNKFSKRASIETTKSVVNKSSRIALNGTLVELAPYTYADITYAITNGVAITAVFLDGQSGNTTAGTIPGVRLFGTNFEFDLRIDQSRPVNWSFSTTSITLLTGGARKLAAPITNSSTLYLDNIPTIPAP